LKLVTSITIYGTFTTGGRILYDTGIERPAGSELTTHERNIFTIEWEKVTARRVTWPGLQHIVEYYALEQDLNQQKTGEIMRGSIVQSELKVYVRASLDGPGMRLSRVSIPADSVISTGDPIAMEKDGMLVTVLPVKWEGFPKDWIERFVIQYDLYRVAK